MQNNLGSIFVTALTDLGCNFSQVQELIFEVEQQGKIPPGFANNIREILWTLSDQIASVEQVATVIIRQQEINSFAKEAAQLMPERSKTLELRTRPRQ